MKRINLALILLVVISGLAASRDLFQKGYFEFHDNMPPIRQMEFEKCLLDLQIPCRWAPDLGNGNGLPLFNYYPPLPYAFGELFRLIGFSFTDSIKGSFVLSILLSGIFMYFWGKEFFGKAGGLVSSIAYIWMPYRAVDIYVRGALNESWSLVFFPLVFLFSYKNSFKLLSLALAGLMLSHSLIFLIFMPFFTVWCIAIKKLNYLLVSSLLGFGLASFFVLPSIFEQGAVNFNNMTSGYFYYGDHFVGIYQLLVSRFWGYGMSYAGTNDGMAFPVGVAGWVLSCVILVFINKKRRSLYIAVFLLAWLSVFMVTDKSKFIWDNISLLKFVQFPWRLLTVSSFLFSFCLGFLVFIFGRRKRLRNIAVSAVLILMVVLNWNYFKVHGNIINGDKQFFSGFYWESMRNGNMGWDYLPSNVLSWPGDAGSRVGEFTNGGGRVVDQKIGTNWKEITADVINDEAVFRFNILYFPNWKVFIDGKEVTEDGMDVSVPHGNHVVTARLFDTPVRRISNIISLVSLGVLFIL